MSNRVLIKLQNSGQQDTYDIGAAAENVTVDLGQGNSTNLQDYVIGKLDKVTSTGEKRVYIINENGSQDTKTYTADNISNTIVSRDGSGNISIASPIQDNHAANKSYVNTTIATSIAAIPSITNGQIDTLFNGSN